MDNKKEERKCGECGSDLVVVPTSVWRESLGFGKGGWEKVVVEVISCGNCGENYGVRK